MAKKQDSDLELTARMKGFLPEERLGIFLKRGNSENSAVGLHQESMKLGLALMSIIGTIEISLRNSIAENMNGHYGQGNWLKENPARFEWDEEERERIREAGGTASRAAWRRLSPKGKARLKKQNRLAPYSESDLLSQFTFYFWKKMYTKRYQPDLWWPTLRTTFPGEWQNGRLVNPVKRSAVYRNLDVIHIARNRIAHHEPVLGKRFRDTLDAVVYIVEHLGTGQPGPNAPLARFLADDIAEVASREASLGKKI